MEGVDYRAVQYDNRFKRLAMSRLPVVTSCGPNEVIVKVAYAGICDTDLQIIEGNYQVEGDRIVLGHEMSGIIIAVGDDVNWLNIGDKVAVNPNSNCERCMLCRHEQCIPLPRNELVASVGIVRDGGWAEMCVVPEMQIYPLPQEVSLEQGVLCETLSCVAHAWDRIAPLPHCARILVIGLDLTGCIMASLLHVQGYHQVTLCEDDEICREIASKLELGYEMITHSNLSKREFDVALDCKGSIPLLQEAAQVLAFGGQLLIFRANSNKDILSLSPYKIFINELKIVGALINAYAFGKAVTWATVLGDRYLDFSALGVITYPLKEFKKALDDFKEGYAAKAVFNFDIFSTPTL